MRKIEKEQALNSAYEIGRVSLRQPEKGCLVPGEDSNLSPKPLIRRLILLARALITPFSTHDLLSWQKTE
jgi:hypothetical protein